MWSVLFTLLAALEIYHLNPIRQTSEKLEHCRFNQQCVMEIISRTLVNILSV